MVIAKKCRQDALPPGLLARIEECFGTVDLEESGTGEVRPGLTGATHPPATLSPMFAAQPWDWWIGVVLFAMGVLAILAIVVGYVYKVVMPQYPRRGQQVQQPESRQKT